MVGVRVLFFFSTPTCCIHSVAGTLAHLLYLASTALRDVPYTCLGIAQPSGRVVYLLQGYSRQPEILRTDFGHLQSPQMAGLLTQGLKPFSAVHAETHCTPRAP